MLSQVMNPLAWMHNTGVQPALVADQTHLNGLVHRANPGDKVGLRDWEWKRWQAAERVLAFRLQQIVATGLQAIVLESCCR